MRKQRIERRTITSQTEWLSWRRGDVTASVIGALFGLHPRETIYGLYARVTGAAISDVDDNVAMRRGRELEDTVARMVQRAHPTWKLRKGNSYLRDVRYRLGATPDYHIRTDDGRKGILQCKTLAPFIFRQHWNDTTSPAWVVLQTLTEIMLARADFGLIAALEVDGYRFALHEYEVPRHPAAEKRILAAVEAFWHEVDAGRCPNPDYSRDGVLIAAMNPHTTPGKEIDLRTDNRMPELLAEREKIRRQLELAEKRCKEIESEIKDKIGDAEIALVRGWRVTCKEISKKEYTVKPTSYRQLRATREEETIEETAA